MTEERHASLQLHQHDGQSIVPAPGQRRIIMRRAKIGVAVVLLLLAVGAGRTLFERQARATVLATDSTRLAKVHVTTISPKPGRAGQGLVLPGTLQGIVEAPIYARAAGYLIRWRKDIGATVEKGEVLAELDTPDVDQQLAQALAARAQTNSSLILAKSSMQRWEALRKKDAVSQQELDERSSTFAQAQSNLEAADANVRRLREQQQFKRVVAPFAGRITRRNVDVGDLIDAGAGGVGRALFTLAQVDRLKTSVFVPQTNSQSISVGQTVTLRQSELPGQTFKGTITRSAGAIDTATRTMQVVVELPNADHKLLPGAYVDVEFNNASAVQLVIPTNSVLFRPEGMRVARVSDDGKVALVKVELGRNFGRMVEISHGVTERDRIVANPPDSLADGDMVDVAAPIAREAE